MVEFDPNHFCDIIDVTLYKFNHYDNLIWTKTLNQLDYVRVDEDSIIITPRQLDLLFEHNFKREIRRIKSVSVNVAHREAHSLFFLQQLLGDFSRMKFIKLTLSKNRNFSRLSISGDNKSINYTFKVLRATIRLNEIFTLEQLAKINPVLKQLRLINDVQYSKLSAVKLLTELDIALNTLDINDEQAEMLGTIMDVFDYKLESDNPNIILVTDW